MSMEIYGDDPDMTKNAMDSLLDHGKNTTPNQQYRHKLEHHLRQNFHVGQSLSEQIYLLQQNGSDQSKSTVNFIFCFYLNHC